MDAKAPERPLPPALLQPKTPAALGGFPGVLGAKVTPRTQVPVELRLGSVGRRRQEGRTPLAPNTPTAVLTGSLLKSIGSCPLRAGSEPPTRATVACFQVKFCFG